MRSYRVVDNTSTPGQNLFKIFAFRNDKVSQYVSRYKWFWLCFVEVLFGEELIESLVTTASVKNQSDRFNHKNYGLALPLSQHIPAGFLTNLFRKQLIEVLFYKYYMQYILIEPLEKIDIQKDSRKIECSSKRFAVFKQKLWHIMPFRRVYVFSWVFINVILDVVVYLITSDLDMALMTAFVVEGVRRLLRV